MIYDIINSRLHNLNCYVKNENGDVVLEGRLKQFVQNLQTDPQLDVQEGETYLEYDIRVHGYQAALFPESSNKNVNYVGSVLDLNKLRLFSFDHCGVNYFISAGTGKGKNTFIKEQLLNNYNGWGNVVIFENRSSLLSQQRMSIVGEKWNQVLMYPDFENENMVTFGPGRRFMLISYQAASKKLMLCDTNFLKYIQNAEYLVFDEAHYFLDDSAFNREIYFVINSLLPMQNIAPKANKIYMSASMEELVLFLQYNGFLSRLYTEQLKSTFLTFNDMSKKPDDIALVTKNIIINTAQAPFLNLPADYSYISPFVYNGYESLIERIRSDNDKWLILVNSKNDGYELAEQLNILIGKNTAVFINSDNKKSAAVNEIYSSMLKNEKFDFKVLIATSVIYNGINIKDEKLRNIVVPETTISVIKQVIGRKRILEGDNRVNVYFPLVDENQIYKRLMGKIREYFDVCNPIMKNICDINSSDSISKYVCCIPFINDKVWTARFTENIAATTKLHFDTMYYLYLYKRIRDDKEAYIKSVLEYMGIPEKFNDLEYLDVSAEEDVQDEMDQEEKLYADFVDFLDKYADKSPIEDKRNEDKEYSVIPDFSEKFDEYYRMINHTEDHFDSHFKSRKRFPASQKFNDIIEKMGLPYTVEITGFDKGTSSKKLIVSRKK